MTNWLRKNWLAVAIVLALALSLYVSNEQASQNDRASVQRSEDTCRRSNPERAYFLLRAHELKSSTASDAPQVLAILNCRAAVASGGKPIPLTPDVQREYLRLFAKGWVPTTRGDAIVGKVPFDVYFAGKGPARP